MCQLSRSVASRMYIEQRSNKTICNIADCCLRRKSQTIANPFQEISTQTIPTPFKTPVEPTRH